MSYIDDFKDVIPFYVRITIGKDRQFINDSCKKNSKNYKGKMVNFYKKATTVEEMSQYGLEGYMEYLPVEEVSLPIEVSIICTKDDVTIRTEKTSKFTEKKFTTHEFRLFDKDNNQVGFTSVIITPAGDIDSLYCSYNNCNLTHELVCHISNDEDGNKEEHFTFEKYDKDGSKSLEIIQKNGEIIGVAVTEKETTIKENTEFPEIRKSINYINSKKIKKYVASCVVNEVNIDKRGGAFIPTKCNILENDLLGYQRAMNQFQQKLRDFKEKTGIEVSIEEAIEFGKLSCDKREQAGAISIFFNAQGNSNLVTYLQDRSNNLLEGFKGEYIGNIFNEHEVYIVTKYQKDGQDYRLYTLVDLTGTSITQGLKWGDKELGIGRDENYFKRLKNADKTPTFVTIKSKDGKEKLILYRGNAVCGKCPEYDEFVEKFISPFSEVKPVKMSQFLNEHKNR